MKTYDEKIEKIVEFFAACPDLLETAIENLDSYCGWLNDDRYYQMDELDELVSGRSVTDLLNMAFFGKDEDSWHLDSSGNKIFESFNPNRDYFRFNGYGNLVSTNYKDYSDYNYKNTIEKMFEYRSECIDDINSDELQELFDALENDEEE